MIEEKIIKAGALILSNADKNKIALLYRSKQNDWSFPKGHVDPGENSTQTMIREIREETGLTISIIQTLPDLEYNSSNGEIVSTKMFIVKSEDDSKLKPEFEKDDIQWIPYNEIVNKLSYDNLKNYFVLISPIVRGVIDSL
jgi:8-oxo-dGTP diphosphatase